MHVSCFFSTQKSETFVTHHTPLSHYPSQSLLTIENSPVFGHPVHYIRLLHGSRSACIDPEVKRSKVKVTRFIKCAASVGIRVDMTA